MLTQVASATSRGVLPEVRSAPQARVPASKAVHERAERPTWRQYDTLPSVPVRNARDEGLPHAVLR